MSGVDARHARELIVPETSLEQWRELTGVLGNCLDARGVLVLRAQGNGYGVLAAHGPDAARPGDTVSGDVLRACEESARTLDQVLGKGILAVPLLLPTDEIFGALCVTGPEAARIPHASKLMAQARRLVEQDLTLILSSLDQGPNLSQDQCRNIEFLEAIVDKANEAILVAQDGRLVFFNPSLERMSGFTHDDLMGQEFISFLHPDDRRMVLERHMQRVQGHNPPGSYDFRIVNKKGDWVWVMIAVSAFIWQDRPATLSLLTNITERKRAEHSLREAERRYRELFENAPVAIFQATPLGRFQSVNPEYARIVGYASAREMLASITDIAAQMYVDPAVRAEYKRQLEENGEVKNFEALLKRVDGSTFWASMNTKAVRDADGNVVSFDGFLTEVTERKTMEQALRTAHADLEIQVAERTRELRKANKSLTALNHQMSAFLSSASHELRTPLTSVLGFAKMIKRLFARHFEPLTQDDPQLGARARTIEDNIEVIELEGERLTRLINDLLDVNKIEAGRMEWRDEMLDTREVVLTAARNAEVRFPPGMETHFILDLADDLPSIQADRDRILQVLANLLDNAAKFTTQGRVGMSARSMENRGVEIRVTDTGPGVPESERDHIFEKFYQSTDLLTDRAKPRGTGLGLAICRQIVEHYGGSIRVEPGPQGKGAMFVVELPAMPRLQDPLPSLP